MEINADKITTGQIDAAERKWIEKKIDEMIEQYQKEKPFDKWYTLHPAPEAYKPYLAYDDTGIANGFEYRNVEFVPTLEVKEGPDCLVRHTNDTADYNTNTYHYYDTGNNFFSPIYITPKGVDMEFLTTQDNADPDTAEQEPEEIDEEDFLDVLEAGC